MREEASLEDQTGTLRRGRDVEADADECRPALPESLETIPKADYLPTQRHRWNTNEGRIAIHVDERAGALTSLGRRGSSPDENYSTRPSHRHDVEHVPGAAPLYAGPLLEHDRGWPTIFTTRIAGGQCNKETARFCTEARQAQQPFANLIAAAAASNSRILGSLAPFPGSPGARVGRCKPRPEPTSVPCPSFLVATERSEWAGGSNEAAGELNEAGRLAVRVAEGVLRSLAKGRAKAPDGGPFDRRSSQKRWLTPQEAKETSA
ncbi:hypothetical protein MRX96_043546 [Rhipicephalus microplus]